MSKNLSELHPLITPDVHGCPIPAVDQAIKLAHIEFCDKSLYWRVEHNQIVTANNVSSYPLTLPPNTSVVTVLEPIRQDQEKVYQRNQAWLNQHEDGWQDLKRKYAKYFLVEYPGRIRLIPIPTEATRLKDIVVVLKPTLDAVIIDDVVFEDYFMTLAAGAKAKLMLQPDKVWSNPERGALAETEFMDGIERAKTKARAGYKTEDTRYRSRPSFF